MFTSVAVRLIVGYFLFKSISWSPLAGAASIDFDDANLCTSSERIRQLLVSENRDQLREVFEHCRDQFVAANKPSPVVKQTIDDWIGADLSQAEIEEILLAYQLALLGRRPGETSRQFAADCEQMYQRFEAFRDAMEPLSLLLNFSMDSMLTGGEFELNEPGRELFSYVQYTQFCKSILEDGLLDDAGEDNVLEYDEDEDQDLDSGSDSGLDQDQNQGDLLIHRALKS